MGNEAVSSLCDFTLFHLSLSLISLFLSFSFSLSPLSGKLTRTPADFLPLCINPSSMAGFTPGPDNPFMLIQHVISSTPPVPRYARPRDRPGKSQRQALSQKMCSAYDRDCGIKAVQTSLWPSTLVSHVWIFRERYIRVGKFLCALLSDLTLAFSYGIEKTVLTRWVFHACNKPRMSRDAFTIGFITCLLNICSPLRLECTTFLVYMLQ